MHLRHLITTAALIGLATSSLSAQQVRIVGKSPTQGDVSIKATDAGELLVSGAGGGGGSLYAKANAAAPTYTEGSTTNPLSVDLSGNLRTIISGTVNLASTPTANLASMAAALADTSASLVKIDQTTPGTTNGVYVTSLPAVTVTSLPNVTLTSGSLVLGKVAIDQTTPGTTNRVVSAGGVAANGTDTDNPIKIGCVAGINVVTAGKISNIACTTSGVPYMSLVDGNNQSIGGPSSPMFMTMAAYNNVNPAMSTAQTSTVASGLVAKAAPGSFYGIEVTPSAAGFVMLFDSTTVPADGTVTPKKCWAVAANTTLEFHYQMFFYNNTGISVAFSSTGCYTKTASATAFISVDYK